MEFKIKPGQIPTTCPECGSKDTGEKYEGDDSCVECYACEAFWYYRNSITRNIVESCPGSDRRAAEKYYEDEYRDN